MNKPIDALMQKEMSRKEFLMTVGFGMMSVMGFGTIIKLLSGKGMTLRHSVSAGYGSSTYGGKE